MNGRCGYVLKPWWMRSLLRLPTRSRPAAAAAAVTAVAPPPPPPPPVPLPSAPPSAPSGAPGAADGDDDGGDDVEELEALLAPDGPSLGPLVLVVRLMSGHQLPSAGCVCPRERSARCGR